MNREDEILKKLQELLPDYCFGRLGAEEVDFFESNKADYPEIIDECREVKAVFDRVEEMDIDKILDEQTRNITVKVNRRLDKKKASIPWHRLALPVSAISLVAFAFYLFDTGRTAVIQPAAGQKVNAPVVTRNFNETASSVVMPMSIPMPEPMAKAESLTNAKTVQNAKSAAVNTVKTIEEISGVISDSEINAYEDKINKIYSNNLLSLQEQNPDLFWGNALNSNELYYEVTRLPDEDFNQLIEDLKDAKIES